MGLQKLKVSEIRTDGGTQMREKISEPTVKLYADLMKDGADFPPPVAFFDGRHYWLADGFHRMEARLANGQSNISCDVRGGSRRDAVLWSISANATHGLPRKHGDKKRAVETLLRDAEWGRWSNASVASRAGVSTIYVANIRRRLLRGGEISDGGTTTYTRGGKTCEKKSQYGKSTADDRPNYKRDWLKFLVCFDAEQFARWKEQLAGRETVNRFLAAEAVEVVVADDIENLLHAGASSGDSVEA